MEHGYTRNTPALFLHWLAGPTRLQVRGRCCYSFQINQSINQNVFLSVDFFVFNLFFLFHLFIVRNIQYLGISDT